MEFKPKLQPTISNVHLIVGSRVTSHTTPNNCSGLPNLQGSLLSADIKRHPVSTRFLTSSLDQSVGALHPPTYKTNFDGKPTMMRFTGAVIGHSFVGIRFKSEPMKELAA